MKKAVSLALLLSIIASMYSCGSAPADSQADTSDSGTTSAAETGFVYTYDKDYGGSDFRILNAGDIYNMRAEINHAELTGETLNDAMYERCRTLEDKLNIVIKETTKHVDKELAEAAQQSILAGEDEYDTIYIPARDLYKFTSENYVHNLLDYDAFNFDREWWISSYNDANTVAGKLYAAAGYSQLMVVDSIWCLFFNETMMTELGLDFPYQLVRDGKWTLDAYSGYLKSAANLNGDDSFTWKDDGKSIYGMSGGVVDKFLVGCGERIVESVGGKLTLTVGSEHFYSAVSKLSKLLSESNGYARANTPNVSDDKVGNYINIFETGRSLFVTAELSKTSRMRDKAYSYGIVPFPKYDEAQKSYYAVPFYGTPCYTIPVTCADPERSAVIGDALTYLSYETVMPVFREVTLEQKGLRNDDSIEMLDIIINSSVPDLVYSYNIGSKMRDEVGVKVKANDDAVASIIASYESEMKAGIDKVNNAN